MRKRHIDEPFEMAWDSFVEQERHAPPPPGLEGRVLDAWRAQRPAAPVNYLAVRRRWTRRIAMGFAGAAGSILVAALFYGDGGVNRSAQDLGVNNSARSSASLRPALLTLSADPIGDTEIIQIVRVCMPRTALVSAGLLIPTTDSSGLVDVDLLVGEDGLPRDIRGVQRVVD